MIFPWKLISDPNGYIFTWLIAYSSLLGPVGGIMIADYYFIRKKSLILNDLYKFGGIYTYNNGVNWKAVIALLLGILPNVPGFLLQVKLIDPSTFPDIISGIYNYAWFVGFFISGLVYYLLTNSHRSEYLKKGK